MRKVLFTIVIMLSLVSCKQPETVELTKEQYKVLVGDTIPPKYPKKFTFIENDENSAFSGHDGIYLGSDNHEYLRFNIRTSSESVSHYIECELCATIKNPKENSVKIKY